MLPKIDLIRAESELYVVFRESWLKPSITDAEIAFRNILPPFRTDRLGGGVVIYARDTLLCRHRQRKVIKITGLERVWLEETIKSKKVRVGGIYRPPNSNSDYFNLVLESIDTCTSNAYIPYIIVTGDFNFNMFSSKNKITDLLQQLITDASQFTETSSSL